MIDPELLAVAREEIDESLSRLERALDDDAPDPRELGRAAGQMASAARLAGLAVLADVAEALSVATGEKKPRYGPIAAAVKAVRALSARWTELAAGDVSELLASLRPPAPKGPEAPPPSKKGAEPEPAGRPSAPRAQAAEAHEPPAPGLVQIFREDAAEHVTGLSDGLLALEQAPGAGHIIDALMRHAHSLKGASRMVHIEPFTLLAHAMEDCFVSVQRGALELGPEDLDVLLSAVDSVAEALLSGVSESGQLTDKSTLTLAQITEQVRAISSHQKPVAMQATRAAPREGPTAPASGAIASDDDKVVRVTAEMADRLLGLSGEGVVEAQRIGPTAETLTKLRIKQNEALDIAQTLVSTIQALHVDPVVGRLLVDLASTISEQQQLVQMANELLTDHARRATETASRLYNDILASRMRPFRDRTKGLARMVRDLARQLDKRVTVELVGGDTLVDRDVLEKLEAPLGHLIRNAVDHGIESAEARARQGKAEMARIEVRVSSLARGMLRVEVRDDGSGVRREAVRARAIERNLITEELAGSLLDQELLEMLFLPGFSTASSVTDVSGRGVGLDVVKSALEDLGGSVRIESVEGAGTTFLLEAPLTRSVLRCLLVHVGGEPFAVPLARVERVVRLDVETGVRPLEGRDYIELEGKNISLLACADVLGLPSRPTQAKEIAALVVSGPKCQAALVVDRFVGEEDLVVRKLDPRLGGVENVLAVATLQDGSLVVIVDVDDVLKTVDKILATGKTRKIVRGQAPKARRILVVDDSLTVREAEKQLLTLRGYEVDSAVDGVDGWNAVRSTQYDLIVTDIDMPRMNGLELVTRLKADEKLCRVPVIIVSYKDREEDRLRGLQAGADAYLAKSGFGERALLDLVNELIGGPHP